MIPNLTNIYHRLLIKEKKEKKKKKKVEEVDNPYCLN